ncbi:hypothetical protein Vretimale_374 [Volvox reticuliferus]|uniref:HMA domain-containing protein n=1 Tax=Volvox reticuliferus TaxID=1737510 RepID=A0A8J4CBX8_9CHLO|nr:hypothetical protein Vretifemale_8129 [Volvox reticuliferus]GIL94042.1 hypothetical protein Vretimale_374 [Volvox reticuliferus]
MLSCTATKARTALSTRHVPKLSSAGSLTKPVVLRHPSRMRVLAFSTGGANPEVKISIEGMMCDGCSSRIEKVLKGMEAVKAVNVSLEGKVAVVQLAKEAGNSTEAQAAAAVVDVINSLGFEARLQQ